MTIALGALQPGTIFAGKYRVERLLGAGGMGAVYLVRHLGTQAPGALKIMQPDVVADATSRARFVQEARVASMIDSAFVVNVTDAGIDEETGIPFFVMEHLRGQELGAMIKARGRLPASELLPLLAQAARALDKAHARGIVHRDLKPENLFVVMSDDEPPKAKVLDFGIAKILQTAQTNSTQASGTPLYMAPEQTARGSNIGPWTDVWAFGLLTYTALVGRPYWEAENIYQLFGEIVATHRGSPIERAAKHGVALPAAFEPWFLRCLDARPEARFARVGEAVDALAGALSLRLASLPPPSLPAEITAPAPPSALAPALAGPSPHAASTTGGAALAQTTDRSGTAPAAAPANRTSARAIVLALAVAAVASVAVGAGAYFTFGVGKAGEGASSAARASVAPAGSGSSAPADAGAGWIDHVERSNPFVAIAAVEGRPAFAIQRHEVTRGEYARFVSSLDDDDKPDARPLREWSGEPDAPTTAHHPVAWVTQPQAQRFCAAIGARLPTSAEWTAAIGSTFPWGNSWPPAPITDVALGRGEDAALVDVESAPVDRTPLDVRDLAGGVREWTSSVEAGFATVRGAAVDVALDDARELIRVGAQKRVGKRGDERGRLDEVAARTLGFRCVR